MQEFGNEEELKEVSITDHFQIPESYKVIKRMAERLAQYTKEDGKLEAFLEERLDNTIKGDMADIRSNVKMIRQSLREIETKMKQEQFKGA